MIDYLKTLANILGLFLKVWIDSEYKLCLASRIKCVVLFLQYLYSFSRCFFFELSRLFIAKSMSFVIQGDCFGRLMRFVTCDKSVLIMFEKIHRNDS